MGVDVADSELYRKYADDLTRFATGLVGPDHAADVVSEAVIGCLGSSGWSNVVAKRSYLFRSVYHEAARFHRSSGRRLARERRTASPEFVELPEIRPEILAAVARLSTRQRAVIVLTYWDDLDVGAIAELLDISEGSVKRHLARGRSHLKEALDADQ
jgi:RNA polymerase sigma factor (sigma-70 family)